MLPPTFLIFHAIYFWYKKHKHLIINSYYFSYFFGHADCDMNSGFDNESTKKEVSNIKQKLALLSSHRLLLRIQHSRRQLSSSRRLQRLSSRQMLNKNSQGLCRVQMNSFCRRHIKNNRESVESLHLVMEHRSIEKNFSFP